MKHIKHIKLNCLLTLALGVSASFDARAGWVTWTTPHSPLNALGTFPANAGAGYGGTISVSTVIPIGGEGVVPGIGGFAGRTSTPGDLTPTFTANLPVNPDGSFTTLATSYNDLGETYEIHLDFSGMQNGYLPKNTLLSILDLDILENYRRVRAMDAGGAQLTSPWLQPLPGAAHHLDWHVAEGDISGLLNPITVQQAGGVYDLLGVIDNYVSSALTFRTTEDISRMSMVLDISRDPVPGTGGPGIALGTTCVPDVTHWSAGILGLAALVGLRFCRQYNSHGKRIHLTNAA